MHQFGTDAAYNWNCGQAFYDTTVSLNHFGLPIFGQRQTQKAYMQYYLNMIASASNNL